MCSALLKTGFNAGSALSAGYRASRAFANTHLAACSALASWGLSEWTWGGEKTYFSGHPSALGAATGVVVGLVAITPACGYVSQVCHDGARANAPPRTHACVFM